jgi:hypothetical protein
VIDKRLHQIEAALSNAKPKGPEEDSSSQPLFKRIAAFFGIS